MIMPIEFLVSDRAFQTKIRAQIDHLRTELKQGNGKFSGHTVWQGQKDNLRLFRQQLSIWLAKTQLARGGELRKFRKCLRQGLSGQLPGGPRR